MEGIVQEKIAKLDSKSRAYLNFFKACFACLIAVVLSAFLVISAEISVVQNLPSHAQLDNPSIEVRLLFFLFTLSLYSIAIASPFFLGLRFLSGIIIPILIILSMLNVFVSIALDLADFGSAIFFLTIGIFIGWLGEVVWAICITCIYSFWKGKSYFVTPLVCSFAVTILTTYFANLSSRGGIDVIFSTCAITVYILFISTLISKKALKEDPTFAWLKYIAISISTVGEISFDKLELHNINFDGIDLAHVDFRGSRIYQTSFRGARNIEFSCVKGTILEDPKVRRLLSMPKTASLSEKDFRNANLTGADLSGLDLEGVDFTGANLTGVDFRNTSLTGANFANSQLFNANFSGACLDEICIFDWAINAGTCFENTKCNWIYLKQSRHGPREKKPDIGEFQPEEFEKWIRQLQDTVDLILREQPNVRALVTAIERVAHSHGGIDPSRFCLESKGDNLYIARVGATPEIDKEKVASTIVVNYNSINELMIQGGSNRLLLNSAGDYMETQNQDIKAGGDLDMSSGARVNIGGDVTGSSITLGDLNGSVSNAIQSIRDIVQGEAQDLASILGALQTAINTDETLSESQKIQAMEAVATLAEESQKPKEQRLSNMCSLAMNALKGITSTLSDASKLADLFKTHMPTLVSLLGLSI